MGRKGVAVGWEELGNWGVLGRGDAMGDGLDEWMGFVFVFWVVVWTFFVLLVVV